MGRKQCNVLIRTDKTIRFTCLIFFCLMCKCLLSYYILGWVAPTMMIITKLHKHSYKLPEFSWRTEYLLGNLRNGRFTSNVHPIVFEWRTQFRVNNNIWTAEFWWSINRRHFSYCLSKNPTNLLAIRSIISYDRMQIFGHYFNLLIVL